MNQMEQDVLPPIEGKLQKIAVTTTGAVTALHDNIRNTTRQRVVVRVKAVTANVEIFFTTSGSDTPPTYGASGTTGVGYPILAGTWEEFTISTETHIAWDADASGLLVLLRCGMERIRGT